MANQFAAPPINPVISVQPLVTPQAGRDTPNVPTPLANVPNGTTVEGFVVNRDAQGNPILRTPVGDVLIKSEIFLKTGSVVLFRVDNTQASRARILTIDGLTPTDYVTQHAKTPQEDTVARSNLLPNLPADAEETAGAKPEPAAIPLRGVLVAPVSTIKPDAALPLPPASAPANNAVPADARPESPLPLILSKLQTGAALKVTLLKIELPVITGTSTPPAVPVSQPIPHVPPLVTAAVPSIPAQAVPAQTQAAAATTTLPPSLPSLPPTAAASALPLLPTQVLPAIPPAVAAGGTPAAHPAAPPLVPAPPLPHAPLEPSSSAPVTTALPARTETHPRPPQTTSAAIPAADMPKAPATVTPSTVPLPSPAFSAYRVASSFAPPPVDSGPPAPAALTSASTGVPLTKPATTIPAHASAPPGIHATVIGHERDGAVILHTRIGTVKTFLPQPLPTGTQLIVRIEPDSTPHAPAPVASTLSESMESVATLARDWKSLTDTVQWLQANDPALLTQLTQQLPQLGPRLTSGLLFFIAAIKGGDLRAWLGNRAVDVLEKKAPELLTRLRSDTSHMQQLIGEGPSRQWSMVMLPVAMEGQLELARLFYRQEDATPESGGKKGGGRQHRFIIEVELSHIGSLQFDGFVRDGSKKRVFDLVIRSARPLAAHHSDHMRAIFDNALKTTGYHGYLAFQQGSQHFVRPLAEFTEDNNGNQPILA